MFIVRIFSFLDFAASLDIYYVINVELRRRNVCDY